MNTLTRANAKIKAQNNNLSLSDLDDFVEKQANASPGTQAARAAQQHQKRQLAPKPSLLSNTALRYIGAAIAKISQGMHPNFRAKATNETVLTYDTITAVATAAIEQLPTQPKAQAIACAKALKKEAKWYVQFWKDICANAAFEARLDILAYTKRLDPEAIDNGLDAMGEEHAVLDLSDVPLYDRSSATPSEDREPQDSAPKREVAADDEDDARDAIKRVQAWCDLAFVEFRPDQRIYWGVDGGVPFMQVKMEDGEGNTRYQPIADFDEYCRQQQLQWDAKRKQAAMSSSTESLLENA